MDKPIPKQKQDLIFQDMYEMMKYFLSKSWSKEAVLKRPHYFPYDD
jgi:hypothetical protein